MARAWSILPWQTTCMMGNSHLHHRPCWPACPSQLWGSGWAAKGTFSPAGQEQLIVFKNPICSLPEVGGFGGRGEGSVSTVTWHWKERPEVSTWLLTRHCSQARHTEASPSSEHRRHSQLVPPGDELPAPASRSPELGLIAWPVASGWCRLRRGPQLDLRDPAVPGKRSLVMITGLPLGHILIMDVPLTPKCRFRGPGRPPPFRSPRTENPLPHCQPLCVRVSAHRARGDVTTGLQLRVAGVTVNHNPL